MSIHVYVWLCIENEEVIVEEEETAPPTETPPAGNSFILISVEQTEREMCPWAISIMFW
jgi:hypothetical protein